MAPFLTPLQILENYKISNPQKCKGKSTIEICRLAGLSDMQIAELKTTSAWLFLFDTENKNQDLSITEIFGGKFNQSKKQDVPSIKINSFENYSEGLDRHISKIQVAFGDEDKEFYHDMGFKTFIPELKLIGAELGISIEPQNPCHIWIEDYMIRLHDNGIYAPNADFDLNDEEVLKYTARGDKGVDDVQGGAVFYGTSSHYIKNIKEANVGKSYIEGGNALITNNSKGEPSVILGEDTLYCTLQALNLKPTPENIKKAKKIIANELHLDAKNVVYIPQIDFHIDMYYRPLHNGQIAVPDYSFAINMLQNNDFGIDEDSKKYLISRLQYANNNLGDILKDAEKELTKNNYEIIKVPCFSIPRFNDGSYQEDRKKLKNINYMNGICGTTTNGKTFYITNSSGYKKLDFRMKQFFKLIGIDKPYFVSTQKLLRFNGGLDCITQEM